jgi:hypothetical protein
MWANDTGLEVEHVKLDNTVQECQRTWWGVKVFSVIMQQVAELNCCWSLISATPRHICAVNVNM